MRPHALVANPDNADHVLLAGSALRAVAAVDCVSPVGAGAKL